MAVNFYVEQADRTPRSGIATEGGIKPGTLVADEGDGVEQFTTEHEDYGVALYDPEYLAADIRAAAHIDGAIADLEYEVDQRTKYQPSEDAAIVKIRTPEDGDAPNIEHRDVVGVSASGEAGRVVSEDYDPETDFTAVGRAYRPGRSNGEAVTENDAPVRVVLFGEVR